MILFIKEFIYLLNFNILGIINRLLKFYTLFKIKFYRNLQGCKLKDLKLPLILVLEIILCLTLADAIPETFRSLSFSISTAIKAILVAALPAIIFAFLLSTIADLKDIAEYFEYTFDIDLGQYRRTFLEIRVRKSERTKFLNALKFYLFRFPYLFYIIYFLWSIIPNYLHR